MSNLAQRILDEIARFPEAFDMNMWHYNADDVPLPANAEPSCGTTLCVAGWAAHLSGWTVDNGRVSKGDVIDYTDTVAKSLLGLDDVEAYALFYASEERATEMLREMASE